jgi:hypothetical protein
VNRAHIQRALDDVHDQALLRHGFADYLRDYELIIRRFDQPRRPAVRFADLRYLFRFCVEAEVRTTLDSQVWRVSLDDRLTESLSSGGMEGHSWWARQDLYPGGRVIEQSQRAQSWADSIGVDFYEVVIETNVHAIKLIVSDLEIAEVESGSASV